MKPIKSIWKYSDMAPRPVIAAWFRGRARADKEASQRYYRKGDALKGAYWKGNSDALYRAARDMLKEKRLRG